MLHIIWCIDVFIVEPYTWANGSRDSQSDISGQSSCTGPSAGCRGKANAAKISQPYHYWRLTEVQEWVLERFHWQVCYVAVPFLLTWAQSAQGELLWPAFVRHPSTFYLNIFSSETPHWILTKLHRNDA